MQNVGNSDHFITLKNSQLELTDKDSSLNQREGESFSQSLTRRTPSAYTYYNMHTI